MLATRLYGREDVRLEDVPDVVPDAGEIRLKVAHNGLCGSDLHMYFHSGANQRQPFVLGHEISGVIDSLGAGVTGVKPGTPVAVRPFLTCTHCDSCDRGLDHLCATPEILGCGAAQGGGLAEYCIARADMVFPLPQQVSLEHGALVEPMAVAYHGITRGDVERGMSVVVFGAGPIGVGVLLGLRALGITDVLVIEPSAARRAAIAALGATGVLDPASGDVVAAVQAHTMGRGADVVFECAGAIASFAQALAVARVRGKVVILAVYESQIEWNPYTIGRKEIELRAARAYQPGVYEAVIKLMADGHYPTAGWVEHIPWTALVEQGFKPLRRGERMKVLVDLER
ncbi:MAG: alcohol dehydrogenase [Rhodospirillaceae bacterium]|nr:MAG: alcohol dehydrogenase [Rhodospirillaceae bacterium]